MAIKSRRFALLGVAVAFNFGMAMLHVPFVSSFFIMLLIPFFKKTDLLALYFFEYGIYALRLMPYVGLLALVLPLWFAPTATVQTLIIFSFFKKTKTFKRIWRVIYAL